MHTWPFVLTLKDTLFTTTELPQAITENQAVSCACAVFEMVMKAFLGTQTLEKLQV
jgi:hypothetical protein